MDLLERDIQHARLAKAHAGVCKGPHGACVLVAGEAGIGKTSLVKAFLDSIGPDTEKLVVGCDALFSPRPLGPLVDLSDRFPPSIAQSLREGRFGNGLFPALLGFFGQARTPPILVIEDAHWADTGTLDFVRYAGRRLRDVRLLMVLTYRSDELDIDHPLRIALADLPADTTERLVLPPLSREAVERLAQGGLRQSDRLFEVTGGNPFFVTEVLARPGDAVPPSVTDAVLGRLARLPASARSVAEWVSLCPTRAEDALLHAVAQPSAEDLDACIAVGLLSPSGGAWAFRHELARLAVCESLRPHKRQARHAQILATLKGSAVVPHSLARMVHHAEAAGLDDEVAALAPLAAREAAGTGGHREAARLLALALRHGARTDPASRASLLESRAHECLLTNLHDRAVRARLEALALRRALGDALAVGSNLRWLARLHWYLDGASPVAFQHAELAIATLESLPPHRELAAAYSTLAHLHLVAENIDGALKWGRRAVELAESVGDTEALAHALNTVGSARLRLGPDEEGWTMLERSLSLAVDNGLDADIARAWNNLFIVCVMQRQYARGLAYAEQGIAFSEARGIDIFTVRLRIRRAFAYLQLGRWDRADEDLATLAAQQSPSPMEMATLQFVEGLLALRRGTPEGAPRLLAAIDAMERLRVEIWFTSTAAARAEVAWLRQDPDGVSAAAEPALAAALAMGDPWRTAELATWLRRVGRPLPAGALGMDTAYALEAAGDWRAAADAWHRTGCPYDRALALAQGDEAARREALAILEELGAAGASAAVRRLLREQGARGVPRGPRGHRRGDPLDLTAREREVFELVMDGLSNAAIATRLHRSERTVENHVSRVLDKAGAANRTQLIAGLRNAAWPE